MPISRLAAIITEKEIRAIRVAGGIRLQSTKYKVRSTNWELGTANWELGTAEWELGTADWELFAWLGIDSFLLVNM
jgi:hypothetical protein